MNKYSQNNKLKILLTGSNGQLGHDLKKLFDNLNIKYVATDYQELDITDSGNLQKFFEKNNDFTHIINCVGYNDVDKAHLLLIRQILYLMEKKKFLILKMMSQIHFLNMQFQNMKEKKPF